MNHKLNPPIWLIIFIVGLPQLSETIYTPSLPEIAESLNTKESFVEFTLTIYLIGFAIGTFIWGNLSDQIGRKPCVITGIVIFIIASFICYLQNSIEILMIGRFIQGLGGSIGSVLGQSITRDSFEGKRLGEVYSIVGSALSLFPAIGPAIGGTISKYYPWNNIFIVLICFASVLLISIIFKLPETHLKNNRNKHSIISIFKCLLKDKKVIAFALIIGSANGIYFSYFAEGSFYLINGLKLDPSQYGLTFIAIAIASMLGGMISKKLQVKQTSLQVMSLGIIIMIISCLIFSISALMYHYNVLFFSNAIMIIITILSQMVIMFGFCMTISNGLALALVDYKYCIGTASSIFGFLYYVIISLFTFIMGLIHNGTLLPMPFYFLILSLFMFIVYRKFILQELKLSV